MVHRHQATWYPGGGEDGGVARRDVANLSAGYWSTPRSIFTEMALDRREEQKGFPPFVSFTFVQWFPLDKSLKLGLCMWKEYFTQRAQARSLFASAWPARGRWRVGLLEPVHATLQRPPVTTADLWRSFICALSLASVEICRLRHSCWLEHI